MSGGGGTQTSTSQTQIDPQAQAAQGNLFGAASGLANPFMQVPNFGVAGFGPDELSAFDMTRLLAHETGGQGAAHGSWGNGGAFGPAEFHRGEAAQLAPGEIMPFMSPFLEASLEPTFARARTEMGRSLADVGAQSAAASPFGGARGALQEAQIRRGFGEDVTGATYDAMAGGFDRAAALADRNADRRQQTAINNTNNRNNNSQFNASGAADMSRFNASGAADMSRFNASADNSMVGADFQRRLEAIRQLLATGATQRGVQDRAIQLPFWALDQLRKATPMDVGKTTATTQPTTGSPLSGIAGIIGALGAFA